MNDAIGIDNVKCFKYTTKMIWRYLAIDRLDLKLIGFSIFFTLRGKIVFFKTLFQTIIIIQTTLK